MVNIASDMEKAASMIAKARKIVVFTGAGISTESGIPDFRSPGGIWTRFDPEDFTIDRFMSSAETRRKVWRMDKEFSLTGAKPNKAHYAIVELEKMDKLIAVITQNIDNLHQEAGNSGDIVIELHGNMREVVCTSCGARFEKKEIEKRIEAGDIDPHCKVCGGILKPDVVFFGEPLPAQALYLARKRAEECDLFIVVGSSLVIYPAAEIPFYAKQSGAGLIIINMTETAQDEYADAVVRGRAGEILPEVIDLAKRKTDSGPSPHD